MHRQTDRYWPKAAPHSTAAERPLLVKADIQNYNFRKSTGERLLSARRSRSLIQCPEAATDPKETLVDD